MATQSLAIAAGAAPADVGAAASVTLVTGTAYILQVIGNSTVNLVKATTAPTVNDYSHKVRPLHTWKFSVSATEKLYVWCKHGNSSGIVITEAVT